jgi:hypothetical protein
LTVRLFYIDESFDSEKFCLSAVAISHTDWRDCFARVREHRQFLKQDYGILMRKEIHSSEFVTGRGRISDRVLGKHERSRVYDGLLRLVAQLPSVMLINVCLTNKDHHDVQLVAWDRLMNRIERTMREFESREIVKRRGLVAGLAAKVADEQNDRSKGDLSVTAPSLRSLRIRDANMRSRERFARWVSTTRFRQN